MASSRNKPASADEPASALRRRIAELEGELRTRDEFIAIAAHELRNPMTPIGAQVELLRAAVGRHATTLPPEIARGIERLDRLVQAYIRRATTLLDVTRIASGNIRLEASELDLSALVRQIAAGMMPAAVHAGSELRVAVADGLRGEWDRLALEQVLDNLLSNAVRYGAGGPIEVSATGTAESVEVRVSDNGIGISEQDQRRIFERFGRGSGNRGNGGFGVGLWLARELVHAMGGEIACESRPGKGATFEVRLPRAAGREAR
jgi:signal transduction histidine kinase